MTAPKSSSIVQALAAGNYNPDALLNKAMEILDCSSLKTLSVALNVDYTTLYKVKNKDVYIPASLILKIQLEAGIHIVDVIELSGYDIHATRHNARRKIAKELQNA